MFSPVVSPAKLLRRSPFTAYGQNQSILKSKYSYSSFAGHASGKGERVRRTLSNESHAIARARRKLWGSPYYVDGIPPFLEEGRRKGGRSHPIQSGRHTVTRGGTEDLPINAKANDYGHDKVLAAPGARVSIFSSDYIYISHPCKCYLYTVSSYGEVSHSHSYVNYSHGMGMAWPVSLRPVCRAPPSVPRPSREHRTAPIGIMAVIIPTFLSLPRCSYPGGKLIKSIYRLLKAERPMVDEGGTLRDEDVAG